MTCAPSSHALPPLFLRHKEEKNCLSHVRAACDAKLPGLGVGDPASGRATITGVKEVKGDVRVAPWLAWRTACISLDLLSYTNTHHPTRRRPCAPARATSVWRCTT